MKLLNLLTGLFLVFASTFLLAERDDWQAKEYHQHSTSQKEAASDLLKYISLTGNEKILDVGCGDGKITAELAQQVPNGSILGIDLSPSMIDFAKRTYSKDCYPNLTFELKNAEDLDFDNEFDRIFSFTTLQWIQDHPVFLNNAYKALKPAGVLAVTMPKGLPESLEKAVLQVIAESQWKPYFKNFLTGWNFIEEASYGKLLTENRYAIDRLATVSQLDIFPTENHSKNSWDSGFLI